MSKLIKEIRAIQTDRHYTQLEPISPLLDVREDFRDLPCNTGIGYDINVQLGIKSIVKEQDREKLNYVTSKARRQIAEYVFGEFRELIHEIQNVAYTCDYKTSNQLFDIADKLHAKMFEEGVGE